VSLSSMTQAVCVVPSRKIASIRWAEAPCNLAQSPVDAVLPSDVERFDRKKACGGPMLSQTPIRGYGCDQQKGDPKGQRRRVSWRYGKLADAPGDRAERHNKTGSQPTWLLAVRNCGEAFKRMTGFSPFFINNIPKVLDGSISRAEHLDRH
jgi:hypothetical protein